MLERRQVACERRDALQAERPDDCWCLGAGGRYLHTIGIGERNPLVTWLVTCSCPEGLAHQERRGKREPELQRQTETMRRGIVWEQAGIPAMFRDFTVASWPSAPDYPDVMRALLPRAGSLLITGPYGRGKTGLAVGYAKAYIDAAYVTTVRFVAAPMLLASLRATYDNDEGEKEAAVIRRYANCDLLILDDIGAEQIRSEWAQDRLYQIIGRRHDEGYMTVFTSNLSLADLGDHLGQRLMWRIIEMIQGRIVDLAGLPNLRA